MIVCPVCGYQNDRLGGLFCDNCDQDLRNIQPPRDDTFTYTFDSGRTVEMQLPQTIVNPAPVAIEPAQQYIVWSNVFIPSYLTLNAESGSFYWQLARRYAYRFDSIEEAAAARDSYNEPSLIIDYA
jgi:hypothetical protein